MVRPRVPWKNRARSFVSSDFDKESASLDTTRCHQTQRGVIAREGGRSSIPETAVLDLDASGILAAPPSRGMTPSGRCASGLLCESGVQFCNRTPSITTVAFEPASGTLESRMS